jgi:cell division protein DivIC
MHNTLTQQHDVKEMQSAIKRKGLIRRLTFLVVLALMVTFSIVSTLISQSNVLDQKGAKHEALKQELAGLKKKQVILKEEIVKLNDDEYIAKLARRDFFLSEGDEIIFTIPEKE